MIKFTKYVKASSLEEAYDLNKSRANIIMGGMMWLGMQNRNIGTAIDISGLGLDKIEENDDSYIIGAMVPLRNLECHDGINEYTSGAVKESLRHIVGVQFRNMATVGGSLYGRYGFSDVLTLFMAIGANVQLYNAGTVDIARFADMPFDNDILVSVTIPKKPIAIAYKSIRNSATDFPVLTCCTAMSEGSVRTAIGARPQRAVLITDEAGILTDGITAESAAEFGKYVEENTVTESNNRASAEYRKKMAGVLTKRCLRQIGGLE
ncbi:MAG: FAD binding domain-containing protein [Lachnospiraceae bacterium]|nr:FAD binding domain-containing protein [Lachnospiraceae bacterium]